MEWVESPRKGRNASTLIREFEERFARLSTLDWTALDTSRVLLFVKSVDAKDQEKIGLLLETDDGLTADWAVVKRVYGWFDKRRDWAEADSVGSSHSEEGRSGPTGKKGRDTTLARRWLDVDRRGQRLVRRVGSRGANADGA
jgi:hypothetical protein